MGAMDTFAPDEAALLDAQVAPQGGVEFQPLGSDTAMGPERIDAILHDREPQRDWPEAMRSAYRETATRRFYQEQHFLFMLGLLSCLATIAVDYMIAPSVAQGGFVYRVLAVCPITLVGLYAASRQWAILTKLCLIAAPSAFIAVIVILAVSLPPEKTAQYLTATPLIVGLANIVMPFTMRELVLFDSALILTAIATLALSSPLPLIAYLDYLALFSVVAVSTLPIALRFERLRQRNFLLNLHATATSQELRSANERLRDLSDRDHLTGLANRRCFDRVFDETIGQRAREAQAVGQPPSRIAVMMIDLDHFKAFNDTHGHTAGDECLRIVGHELGSIIDREGGVAARYGGEEFVVALCEKTPGDIGRVSENVRHAIAALLVPVGRSGRSLITASIGIALAASDRNVTREELVEVADAALYNAKRAGRNRVKAIEIETEDGTMHA